MERWNFSIPAAEGWQCLGTGWQGMWHSLAVPGGKDSPNWIINVQTKAKPCLAVLWLLTVPW